MNRKQFGYIKSIICMVLLLVACCAIQTTSYAEGRNGWYKGYYYVDGVKQKSKWIKDEGHTYYVNASGKKVTGWKKIKNRYYYFNEAEGGKIRNSRYPTGVRLSKLSKNVLTIGVDMSQWQGNVNWKKIKSAGVDFVMLRLGYGKGRYGSSACTMDEKFKSYVQGAKSVGIPIGIYFYSYATTPEQAMKEAEYTIENIQGIDIEFPVAYDIEDPAILEKTDTETRTQMCKSFMDTIAAAGYTPMLYSNLNWYENYLDSEQLKDYEFWFARYTYIEPDRNVYDFGMWQATSTQIMSGITENTVDLDFLYKDYFSLIEGRNKALKYGWHTKNNKKYYYYQGKRMKSGWFSMGGEKYYLKKGAACTGWKKIRGKKYYFNDDGEMQTGFTKVDGKIYLLDSNGVLQTTTDEPGVTIRDDGSCKIKRGWNKTSDGHYIYRKKNGGIVRNHWLTRKGKRYYCDGNGYRVTGMQTIKDKKYFFAEDGAMKTGWVTYKKNRYYFKLNGEMKTGWLRYRGNKYYLRSNGKMVKNKTIKIKGKRYTFDKKGRLVK